MCVELIKNLVESEFDLQLTRKTRKRVYIEARAMYYMLLRKKSRMTMDAISDTLGKNHATVLHGIKSLKNWMKYDTNLKNIYDTLDKKADELIKKNPEAFNRANTSKEWHEIAFEDMEKKYEELEMRYIFLLGQLKKYSKKSYERFKELETNDV